MTHPPQVRAGRSRVGLVIELLGEALGGVRGARALDCGGGSGTYAVPLAAEGAQVTVVDISADALATLRRRAAEQNLPDGSIVDLAGDVDSLADLFDDSRFDLVLAHGVLDAVTDPSAAFSAMAALVRPGGVLSVLVANPVAAVLGRALAGDAPAALDLLRRDGAAASGGHATAPDEIVRLAAAAGLDVAGRFGIGAFSDLMPGSAGETAAGREAIAALDAAAVDRQPYAAIASRIHLVLRRPG
ncbi:class I SAM-dependent methyltransferase [Jatrophihabitans fulvus]